MKPTIVLNGGLKTCCSTYSSEFVYETVRGWLNGVCDVLVIDAEKGNWAAIDDLASLAIKYFGQDAYPFVYIDDVLISIGSLPDKEELIAMLSKESREGITHQDITEAAKRYGKIKD